MANYWPDVWTDLRTAITTTWPEVGVIMRTNQAEKLNWANIIADGKLTPPYVGVHFPPAQESDAWGMANIFYETTVTFHYVATNSGTDMGATLEERLKTMQDYVKTSTSFTAIEVMGHGLVTDVTEANPVNQSMLEANMPYSAGSLTFDILFGESAS